MAMEAIPEGSTVPTPKRRKTLPSTLSVDEPNENIVRLRMRKTSVYDRPNLSRKIKTENKCENGSPPLTINAYNNDALTSGEEYPELDSRQVYRRMLQNVYPEQDKEKYRLKESVIARRRRHQLLVKEQQIESNKLLEFVRYLATEHETLLQILIFLPLMLLTFYIAVIENSPLVRPIKD